MEQFSVYEQRVCLEFNEKDTTAAHDYLVDFAPMLPAGAELSEVAVEIEGAGNTESPITLEIADAAAAPGIAPTGSPPLNTGVYFWLTVGTTGVRYLGKITATVQPDGSPPPQARVLVKRFLIVVQGYDAFGSPDDERGSPNVTDDSSPGHHRHHHHRWWDGEPQW